MLSHLVALLVSGVLHLFFLYESLLVGGDVLCMLYKTQKQA